MMKKENNMIFLDQYKKDIRKMKILGKKEELKLVQRIEKGDREAVKKLVESNLRFVPFIARKYRGLGVPFEDLINEGNIGLIRAARKFDSSKGAKFVTYAVWWIHTSIKNALSRQQNIIRIPYRKTSQFFKMRQKEDCFYRDFQKMNHS